LETEQEITSTVGS